MEIVLTRTLINESKGFSVSHSELIDRLCIVVAEQNSMYDCKGRTSSIKANSEEVA